jgi:hypothetical protein
MVPGLIESTVSCLMEDHDADDFTHIDCHNNPNNGTTPVLSCVQFAQFACGAVCSIFRVVFASAKRVFASAKRVFASAKRVFASAKRVFASAKRAACLTLTFLGCAILIFACVCAHGHGPTCACNCLAAVSGEDYHTHKLPNDHTHNLPNNDNSNNITNGNPSPLEWQSVCVCVCGWVWVWVWVLF